MTIMKENWHFPPSN